MALLQTTLALTLCSVPLFYKILIIRELMGGGGGGGMLIQTNDIDDPTVFQF